jgi:LysR family transcriptional regulator of abg operon
VILHPDAEYASLWSRFFHEWDMRLQGIENFVAIADAGSIRAAARQVGISQPALTRSLQALEKELGVRLMRRSVQGISLTPEGIAFSARARVVQSELAKAAADFRQGLDAARALLTVGMSAISIELLLPEFVLAMRRHFPKTRIRIIEISPSPLLSIIRDTPVEIVVTQRTNRDLEAGLNYRPLFDVQLRIGARAGHPLAGTRRLDELAGATWLATTVPGNANDRLTHSMTTAGLPPPAFAVHCGSLPHLIRIAASSDMLLQMPSSTLRPLVEAGKLSEVPLTKPLAMLRLGLYSRADTPPTRVARGASKIMSSIARRYATSGELRGTAPLVDRR